MTAIPWIRALVLSAILATCAFAQAPVVNSAVNAASFETKAGEASKLARGGIFSIFGTGIGAATGTQAREFPLPAELAGSSVQITVNGVTKSAIILFAISTQINAILPSDLPSGAGALTVTYNGQTSAPLAIAVVDHAFGAFTIGSSGIGNAVATDAFTGRLNLATGTAQEGGIWDVWGTGLGPVDGSDAVAPVVFDQPVDVQVFVGGQPAQVIYRGRSPCCAGLDQIRFIVPAGVEGCCVNVEVKVNGVTANSVGMSFSPDSRLCSASKFEEFFGESDLADLIAKGKFSYGSFIAQRFVNLSTATAGEMHESFSGTMPETGLSFAGCGVTADTTLPSTLPIGDCTTMRYDLTVKINSDFSFAMSTTWIWSAFDKDGRFLDDVRYEYTSSSAAPAQPAAPRMVEGFFAVTGVRWLDAGNALSLQGPGGITTAVPKIGLPTVFAYSWQQDQMFANGVPTGVLRPGKHTVSAPGGADVGAFSFDIEGFQPLDFLNASDFAQPVRLDQPLKFQWSGGGPDIEKIGLVGSSGRSTESASGYTATGTTFACFVDSGAGTYSIPVPVLQKMVPSDIDTGTAGLEAVSTKDISIPSLDFSTASWSNTFTLNTKYVADAAAAQR